MSAAFFARTFAAVILTSAVSLAAQSQLTVADIYGAQAHLSNPPSDFAWSPDGKLLSYIDNGELVAMDTATRARKVLIDKTKLDSLTQIGGTEQDMDHRARYGMASYLWGPDSRHLLFDSDGHLWLFDLKTGAGIEAGFTGMHAGDNPTFSPNGESIVFLHEHTLNVAHPRNLGPIAGSVVVPAPGQNILNGEVDWVYAEELEVRTNYAWSPDSKNLAFLQMNETAVPEYPLTDFIPTHAHNDMQRYPQAGDANPDVRVGVVNAGGGKTNWIKLPIKAGQDYIPRFGWVDHHTIWIETLSRDHKSRTVWFADPSRDSATAPVKVLEITDAKFLDDNYDVWVGEGAIVLTGWQDGHNHIYLYPYDKGNPLSGPAKSPKQLTSGEWDVSSISSVDFSRGIIFYQSNETAVLDRQLNQISFKGENKALTSSPGNHDGNFSPDGSVFVDDFSSLTEPERMSFCRIQSDRQPECTQLWAANPAPAGIPAPQWFETKAKDGTTLYATITLPPNASNAASVPLIVNPYGGPGVQTVLNKWGGETSRLFDALLTQHGFAVLHADNRGMAGRGRDFHQAAYRNLGPVQFADQMAVVDAVLEKYPQLDAKRLGWWGWSWGGTFTMYALTHSDRFRAGVSVAPVTDWRNYDSVYTERYLGLPSDSPDAYKEGTVQNSAANLKGRLLIMHGTGDDNVHIANTVQFVQKLIDAGLPYDLQIFPRKTHSIHGPEVRTELYTRLLDHFERYLK